MYLKAEQATYNYSPGVMNDISVRCPNPECGKLGTFIHLGIADVRLNDRENNWVGLRRCPSTTCKTVIAFFRTGNAVEYWPTVKFDFDPSDIPEKVRAAFEEAVTCHSTSCFIASAIMVRKTIEVLCDDRNATGVNLKERVNSLRSKIILPEDLMDSVHDLRILGNDAAHVELKDFDDIGKDEVDVALELCKEVLKAVYQYGKLRAKIQSLKKTTNP